MTLYSLANLYASSFCLCSDEYEEDEHYDDDEPLSAAQLLSGHFAAGMSFTSALCVCAHVPVLGFSVSMFLLYIASPYFDLRLFLCLQINKFKSLPSSQTF